MISNSLSTRLSHKHHQVLPNTQLIELPHEAVEWAQQMASSPQSGLDFDTNSRAQVWAYLESLAIAGFAQWVTHSHLNLTLSYNRQKATGMCCVNERHRIAVVPVIGMPNRQVAIPKAAVRDRSVELIVLVAVQTEKSQANPASRRGSDTGSSTVSVRILAALSRQQIESSRLTEVGNEYLIEFTEFKLASDQVLSYLEALGKSLGRSLGKSLGKSPRERSIDWTKIGASQGEACQKNCASLAPNSPDEELAALIRRFDPNEVMFPPETSGVYIDLSIAEYKLRLYALTWIATPAAELEGLGLFLILGPVQGSYLPIGTRLTVKENNLLLTEPNLRWTAYPTYLYTQVFGLWEEKLTVEVLLPNTCPFALPPLNFAQKQRLD
jgi:hypothetical protein